jgi:hypothetical protein
MDNFQTRIPDGSTLLGTILSSDKTNITAMTGGRIAHPLLISLANIKMEHRAKGSHHAYLLLALLPIPKFIEKNTKLRGVLENRLVHECLDLILKPLKKAATIGAMLNDPRGFQRYCFTPLAAYIADTPEAQMISCVGGKTSHLTMAMYKQFGDPYPHEPRTASTTLAKLAALLTKVDPVADIQAYVKEAATQRLNGVDKPFWRDWPLAEPVDFFPPEPLHHWHKMWWDHDFKWCIKALGNQEIDFRFSVLHPHTGFRHFGEGVSGLKQVTGRDHRNLQRYVVGVIAGAAPDDFVIAIRSLLDFRYLAQAHVIDDNIRDRIRRALQQFHDHKQAILDAGVRTGKGNKPINNWHIPKLEMMQSVYSSIQANGVPLQWSADVTEHAHIEVVKQPGRSSNNRQYEEQICRTLDRLDKARTFDLATAIREAEMVKSRLEEDDEEDDRNDHNDHNDADIEAGSDIDGDDTSAAPSSFLDNGVRPSRIIPTRALSDYFLEAQLLKLQCSDQTPRPFRTWCTDSTAFRMTRSPGLKTMPLDDVVDTFSLPDLIPALSHFLQRLERGDALRLIGGRRQLTRGTLPFNKLRVWNSVVLQQKDYHRQDIVLPAQKLHAQPPCEGWPHGRYDIAYANTDSQQKWPRSGLSGKSRFRGTHLLRLNHSLVAGRTCCCPAPTHFLCCVASQLSRDSRIEYVFGLCPSFRNRPTESRQERTTSTRSIPRIRQPAVRPEAQSPCRWITVGRCHSPRESFSASRPHTPISWKSGCAVDEAEQSGVQHGISFEQIL